jgi:hypothetical protein
MRREIAHVARARHAVVALRISGAASRQADIGAAVLSQTDVDRADVAVGAITAFLAAGGARQVLTDAALHDAVVVRASVLIVALAVSRATVRHGRVQAASLAHAAGIRGARRPVVTVAVLGTATGDLEIEAGMVDEIADVGRAPDAVVTFLVLRARVQG